MATLKIVVVLLATITVQAGDPEDVHRLLWVESANPIVDAKAAIKRNDYVLLRINGYTWTIPGVEESRKFEIQKGMA